MAKVIDSKIPAGPVPEKWKEYKAHQRLVNPKNKLKLDVIVVGTGLAGASAAASLGEMGFNVINLCIQDSPRRAHSVVLTLSQLRVVSTPLSATRTMVTLSTVCSMIQ